MPNDPGFASDTCIFMEAFPGDGGVHNDAEIWWLSPDISLSAAHDSAKVTLHRKPAASGCTTIFSESVTAELWSAGPSLAMVPNNQSSAKNVQNIGAPFPAEGATVNTTMALSPPLGLDHSDPHHPHDVCLVARCYPDSLTPSSQNFFVPGDQHVAQHNLCVVQPPAGGLHLPPSPPHVQSSQLTTVNPDQAVARPVKLRATADGKPSRFVQKIISARLHDEHGALRLATTPAQSFKFVLPDFPNAQVTDHSHPSPLNPPFGGTQTYEARITLGAGQLTRFTFSADLTGGQTGDTYIFHLRQIGPDNHDQGGLTLVMIAK